MQQKPNSASHVLLIEQDQDICDLLTTLLHSQGYSVSTAQNGTEALQRVWTDAPDAVFSSLVFKDMDGFDLCRSIRAMPGMADRLVVALTGYCESGIRERVAASGFDAYLLKPVAIQSVLALLDRSCKRSAA